jgi:hypothetical protein
MNSCTLKKTIIIILLRKKWMRIVKSLNADFKIPAL